MLPKLLHNKGYKHGYSHGFQNLANDRQRISRFPIVHMSIKNTLKQQHKWGCRRKRTRQQVSSKKQLNMANMEVQQQNIRNLQQAPAHKHRLLDTHHCQEFHQEPYTDDLKAHCAVVNNYTISNL